MPLGELTDGGLKPIDPNAKRQEFTIEPVLEGLRSPDGKKVFRAVFELHRFGERARVAVPDLLRVAISDEFGLRQAAVNMLAAVAPDDPRAKAAALQALISIKVLSAADLARIKDMENDADKDVARRSEIALRNIRLRVKAAEPNAASDGGGV